MFLGKVIGEKLVDYFAGPHWTEFVEALERAGGDEILHTHIYTDTVVHPERLAELVLEIEWDYKPEVVFRAGREAFILPVTAQKVEAELAGYPWVELHERQIDDVLVRLQERVPTRAPALAGAGGRDGR